MNKKVISIIVICSIICVSLIGTIVVLLFSKTDKVKNTTDISTEGDINNSYDESEESIDLSSEEVVESPENTYPVLDSPDYSKRPERPSSYSETYADLELTADQVALLEKLDMGEGNYFPTYYLIDYNNPVNHVTVDVSELEKECTYTSTKSDTEIIDNFRTSQATDILDQICEDEQTNEILIRYYESILQDDPCYNKYSVKINNKCYTIYETYGWAGGFYNEYDTAAYCD